ncbi:UDP-phosphate alpha-N-acetylglucosaminyl 1-phosphate transferase [Amycolatopsis sp. MJM2582]|uniref:Undecaprenyl-phosphate alpha-N-acetylglucosaminyl 1-phosphate transferase n=1 Tax=Amycolatopsis keratiniphila subsp. keratiniphila TaxID=227715 RepID=A0A1W2LTV1_9PSEU|nr:MULTISPECIES: MraY family glycosyltransferase [Amycolatopsis]KFZ80030.1 UDP-phosphate alpha-N-acetylglucosaminyl 1-phosphate transferase [Amycolatopsis sp. MJM2582]OLZ44817.1 undecaprenyl-phosphate alpha-N-acetylglucosaminyl 1-phosphate transferase [Amycolatopsis keratiniphila subsp. nogabecina]ONF68019.1 undecaprenyl-phosphate alpha-N-acetylglucosaminyl 1-phosphate transferase [Amycolatopsis keratiniphila subsp. keratiniphila]RSN31319.1 undecaprenyl/decaprenyl-phosphate alpha-N-acetylglucos
MPPTQGLPIREYILVALTAAAVTFLLTGVVRRVAIRIGAIANPRARDVHVTPIPRMGGIGIFLGVAAAMGLAHQLPALSRGFDFSFDSLGVLLAAGVISLIGALDDRFELDAWTKLAGQVMCAGILVIFGVQWVSFWVPWGGGGDSFGQVLVLDKNQGALLTVVLVVVMVNAMNFVDGLDGLAGGLGFIAAAATCSFSLGLLDSSGGDVGAYPPALIAATLAGACLGFLPYNFQPAKIFMGDSGSMMIGLMLAGATTSASGRVPYPQFSGKDALALLSPLVVVAAVLFVPLLDLIMAVIRRTRRGESPFAADKMHLHHRLLEIGHSQRRAVLLIYLWAGLLAFGAVSVTLFDSVAVFWIVGFGFLLATLVSIVPRLRSRNRTA